MRLTLERGNRYKMYRRYYIFFLKKICNREHLHLIHHNLSLWSLQSQQLATNQKSRQRQTWILLTAGGPPYKVHHQVLARNIVSVLELGLGMFITLCIVVWAHRRYHNVLLCQPHLPQDPFVPGHWSMINPVRIPLSGKHMTIAEMDEWH